MKHSSDDIVILVAVIAAALMCSAASAAVYVVDGGVDAAADDAAGTVEEPLRTISAAASRVKPGDTIRVKSGVYRERVEVPAGKEGARITLEAFEGHEPVVAGSELVTGPWKRAEGLPEGVHICGWDTYSSLVLCDGEPLEQIGVQGYPGRLERDDFRYVESYKGRGREDMEPGTFHYDAESKQLYVWLWGGWRSGGPHDRGGRAL